MGEDLSILLVPKGRNPTIGPELGRTPYCGIARYRSNFGSTRYILFDEGLALAALQVVSRDGRSAIIANVYTLPTYRRKGLARALLERARKDFEHVGHSSHLTEAGKAWKQAVRDRRQRANGYRKQA